MLYQDYEYLKAFSYLTFLALQIADNVCILAYAPRRVL